MKIYVHDRNEIWNVVFSRNVFTHSVEDILKYFVVFLKYFEVPGGGLGPRSKEHSTHLKVHSDHNTSTPEYPAAPSLTQVQKFMPTGGRSRVMTCSPLVQNRESYFVVGLVSWLRAWLRSYMIMNVLQFEISLFTATSHQTGPESRSRCTRPRSSR